MERLRSMVDLMRWLLASESGAVRLQKSLPLALVAGILTGAAVLLGPTPGNAVDTCPGVWGLDSDCKNKAPEYCSGWCDGRYGQSAGGCLQYSQTEWKCCCY